MMISRFCHNSIKPSAWSLAALELAWRLWLEPGDVASARGLLLDPGNVSIGSAAVALALRLLWPQPSDCGDGLAT